MTNEDFVSNVWGRLKNSLLHPEDALLVYGQIKYFFDEGYTVDDTVNYHKLMEYFDDTISEESALKEMKKISDKYQKNV